MTEEQFDVCGTSNAEKVIEFDREREKERDRQTDRDAKDDNNYGSQWRWPFSLDMCYVQGMDHDLKIAMVMRPGMGMAGYDNKYYHYY